MKPARGPCAPPDQSHKRSVRSTNGLALDLFKDVDSGGRKFSLPTRFCCQLSFEISICNVSMQGNTDL